MILSAGNMYGLVSTISVNRLLMAGPHAVHILVLLIWLVSLKMYTISISRNGQINKSCIFSRIGTGPRDRMLICGVITIKADEVELFVNGKSQGIKSKDDNHLHVFWRVKYEREVLRLLLEKQEQWLPKKKFVQREHRV